jgi:PAS domain S-box-containing protein
MTCSQGAVEVINNYTTLVAGINRVNFLVREQCFPDPNLPVKVSLTVPQLLELVKSLYNSVRYGTGTASGLGFMGVLDSIDEIVQVDKCNSTSTNGTLPTDMYDDPCNSLDYLVQRSLSNSETFFHKCGNLQMTERYTEFSTTFSLTDIITLKMDTISDAYTDFSLQQCSIPFSPLYIYVACLIVVLLLVIPLWLQISTFIAVNHQIRSMLTILPAEIADSIPGIKTYVSSFNTASNVIDRYQAKRRILQDSKTQAIVENASDGVIVCNETGTIVELNAAARSMFGYSPSDVVGKHFKSLFLHVHEPEIVNMLKDLVKMRRGTTKDGFEGKTKSGAELPVRLSSMIGNWGNEKNMIAVFVTDCTIEKKQQQLLSMEKANNERLLLSILPAPVATLLKKGETNIAETFTDVTCFFSDMVGFTKMSSTMSATDLVTLLNSIVNSFDDLCAYHEIEKIKTIGDAYFCVGGLHSSRTDHPHRVIRFAQDALRAVDRVTNGTISIRCGVHTGPIVAGVIGKSKFAYDCWGDTVNMASRMESTGTPGRVQVSRQTYERVHDAFKFEERHGIEVKGKGTVTTYLLIPEEMYEEERNEETFHQEYNQDQETQHMLNNEIHDE